MIRSKEASPTDLDPAQTPPLLKGLWALLKSSQLAVRLPWQQEPWRPRDSQGSPSTPHSGDSWLLGTVHPTHACLDRDYLPPMGAMGMFGEHKQQNLA